MPDIRQTSQPDQSCSGKSGDQANEGNSWEVYPWQSLFCPWCPCFVPAALVLSPPVPASPCFVPACPCFVPGHYGHNWSIDKIAFSYLKQKQEKGSKERNLHYEDKFMMADYLCPNDQLSVEDQRVVCQIRSRKNHIEANIGNPQLCPTGFGNILENPAIWSCEILNPESKLDMNKFIKWFIKWNKNISYPIERKYEEERKNIFNRFIHWMLIPL